ncbi:hypothetical protein [Pseudomonas frederiksbergensis]|uniref:Delta-60 repeat domain-containing protein n=1 Tax=Pseudomonas frederiksbergensis TaxID=104087 RepID=A0A423K334_9PSED|nr:hypothetical protein [Pseudomonas frederiksbergensis]RON45574.1 hypothetical protein BK667_25980 [Pseudomonas frederiksbergensis]RON45803.1 hypothetical protein BK666_14880 [Pseudomonas frederiksbergensis]
MSYEMKAPWQITAVEGIDPTFADKGVAHDFPLGTVLIKIVGRRPDGRILLVTSRNYQQRLDFQVIQLMEDGSFDLSFAQDGILSGGFKDGAQAYTYGAQLFPDGRILLIGTHYGDIEYLAFGRYLADGTPDATFGDNGVVLRPRSSVSGHHLPALSHLVDTPRTNTAIGPNDEIIMASGSGISRYDRHGEVDLSFNGTGNVTPSFNITDIGIARNGSMTLVGHNTYGEAVMARYRANGSLEESFGNHGEIKVRVNDTDSRFTSLLLRDDGSLFAAGVMDDVFGDIWGERRRGFLTAYNANGQPNLVFGGGRPVISLIPSKQPNVWNDIGGSPEDGIVVVGYAGRIGSEETLIGRYRATGEVDLSFGTHGFLQTDIGFQRELWESVVVQPDRKIIACGDVFVWVRGCLARFLA